MHPQAIYYAIPLLLGSTAAISLVFLAWQRLWEPGARAFMLAMAGVALWSFAYAFEVMNPTLQGKLPWHRLIYMTSSVVPAAWMIFLLQQKERPKGRMRQWIFLLSIEPVLYTLLTWTNDIVLPGMAAPHHLLWQQIDVSTGPELYQLVIDRSIGFYIHTLYTYSLVLFSLVIVVRLFRRESSTLPYWRVALVVCGIFAPLGVNAMYLAGFNPLPINLTTFALVTMGMAVGWFAFRFELWDMLPAAHNAIFEHMHDGVIVLNKKHQIIDLNPAAFQLLSITQERVLNQSIEVVLPEWQALTGLEPVARGDDARVVKTFELLVSFPTPRSIEVAVSALRDRRQRVNGRLLTIRDMTKRREMEQALEEERALLARRVAERTADLSEANTQLARAVRLKDEFMASMSHELRTPLNAILGLSEALQDQVYGTLTVRQSRALTHIEESGRHLLSLINDVLDVAKIEAGKFKLEIGPVEVDSLCQAALNFIKQSALGKGQELIVELDQATKVVYGDERRLKQILINLLNNAVKFTPNGGQVGLRVQGNAQEEWVQFTVWDTGVGIDATDMRQLFEPFIQLDSRLARQYEGTGLGLALVYRMTKLHGGGVTVASEVGNGSQFSVAIPWSTPEQSLLAATKLRVTEPARHLLDGVSLSALPSTDALPPLLVPSPVRRKVFIVEEEATLSPLVSYLQARGYAVDVAHNGLEALLRLRALNPDVILLDIQIPGMNGLEVMQQVRKEEALRTIPILALTALAMPGDRDRCLAAGADVYLSKPVSLQRLVHLIEMQECRGE